MYGYVKKKKKKKNWKRIGVEMEINFMCAEEVCKNLILRGFCSIETILLQKKERSIFLCMRILGRM